MLGCKGFVNTNTALLEFGVHTISRFNQIIVNIGGAIMPEIRLSTARISYQDWHATIKSDFSSHKMPIVLIHGFSSSLIDNWLDTGWIKFLNDDGWRVIALDNRGHGRSEKFYEEEDYSIKFMAADIIDLLDHLGIEKAHIMGYSMGSRIAAMISLDHSERVGRLILGGNGYGMIEGSGDWVPIRDGLLAQSIEDIKDPRALAFRRFADRTHSDKKALAACAMGLRQMFTKEQFGQIKLSTLIAIGSLDDIAGSGKKLAQCMPNARFFSIPDRDHMRASTDKSFKNEVAIFLQEM